MELSAKRLTCLILKQLVAASYRFLNRAQMLSKSKNCIYCPHFRQHESEIYILSTSPISQKFKETNQHSLSSEGTSKCSWENAMKTGFQASIQLSLQGRFHMKITPTDCYTQSTLQNVSKQSYSFIAIGKLVRL